MIEVSVSELRARLPEYLRLAVRKGPVIVTSRGREVARLVGPESVRGEARKKLKALGRKARIGDTVSPVLEGWGVLK